jgi:methyl-accepting chemotaxis protein
MALTTNQESQPVSSKLEDKKSKQVAKQPQKKQGRSSRGTIGTKLLVLVLGSTILGLGTSGYLYYQELTNATQRQIEKNLSLQVSEIEGKLSPVQQSAIDLSASVKALHNIGIKDPEIYKKMVFEHFKRLNFAIALGVGQAPNALVGDRKWFYPSFYRELPNAKSDIKTGQRLPAPNTDVIYSELFETDNYPDKKYWREPTAIEEGLWLEPYEASNGMTMTAYVAPFYSDKSDKKLLGVTSADLSVVSLTQKLNANVLGNAGNFIVLSNAGTLLSYPPDISKVKARETYQKVPELRAVWEQIQGKTSGIVQIEGKYYAFRRINDNKWWVLAVLPQSYVLERVLPIAVGTTVAVGTILILIVLWFVWSLNRRLSPILNECDKLATAKGGELALPKGKDEIDRLDASVKNMMAQIANNEERIKQEVTAAVTEQERINAEREAERESAILEQEVGTLLDVVSAFEEGDLTTEAEVSDRATGLVADTLNRLRERLSEIISNVLGTAQRVAKGAEDLENLAGTVAENTVSQAQSVSEGRALTEQVALSAQNSVNQVQISNQALLEVQATVGSGQVAIDQLTDGIAVLQKGSAQIVQRMKTLGEFVGLAEQFVQDQSQIASLTQVLAINATLVAARAAEQKDPKLFTGVAREFEAIAGQVNDLATQTSDGLTVLRQRTSQIQAVVSAVDAEVQNLGGLVAGFTAGVEQSQIAFATVQTKTSEVSGVGQKVTDSSLEIAAASDSTAKYMSEIATLAQRTAELTGNARLQAEQMGDLAQRLLEGIRFFRLPAALEAQMESESHALHESNAFNNSFFGEIDTLSASEPSIESALDRADLMGVDRMELAQQNGTTQNGVVNIKTPDALLENEVERAIPLAAIATTGAIAATLSAADAAVDRSEITGEITTPQFETETTFSGDDDTDGEIGNLLNLVTSNLEVEQDIIALDFQAELTSEELLPSPADPVLQLASIADISVTAPPTPEPSIAKRADLEQNQIEPEPNLAASSLGNLSAPIPDPKPEVQVPQEQAPKRVNLEDDFAGFNLFRPIVLSRSPEASSKNKLEIDISGLDLGADASIESLLNQNLEIRQEQEEIEIDASLIDETADLDINKRFDAMLLELDTEETSSSEPQALSATSADPTGDRQSFQQVLNDSISILRDLDEGVDATTTDSEPDSDLSTQQTAAPFHPTFDGLKSFSNFDEDVDQVTAFNVEDDEPTLGLPTKPIPIAYLDPNFSFDKNDLPPLDEEFSELINLRFNEVTELTLDGSNLIPEKNEPEVTPDVALVSDIQAIASEPADTNPADMNIDLDSDLGTEALVKFMDDAVDEFSDFTLRSDEEFFGVEPESQLFVESIDEIQLEGDVEIQAETAKIEIQDEADLEANMEWIIDSDEFDTLQAPNNLEASRLQTSAIDEVFANNLSEYEDLEDRAEIFAAVVPSQPTSVPFDPAFDGLKSFSNFDEDIDRVTAFNVDDDDTTFGMPAEPIPVAYLEPNFSFDKTDDTPPDDELKELMDLSFDGVTELTLDGSNLIFEKEIEAEINPDSESDREPDPQEVSPDLDASNLGAILGANFDIEDLNSEDRASFDVNPSEELLDLSSDASLDDFSAFNIQVVDESYEPELQSQFMAPSIYDDARDLGLNTEFVQDFDSRKPFSDFEEDVDLISGFGSGFGIDDDEPMLSAQIQPIPVADLDLESNLNTNFSFDETDNLLPDDEMKALVNLSDDEINQFVYENDLTLTMPLQEIVELEKSAETISTLEDGQFNYAFETFETDANEALEAFSPAAPDQQIPTPLNSPLDEFKSFANFDEDIDFEVPPMFEFDDEPSLGTLNAKLQATYNESDFMFTPSVNNATFNHMLEDADTFNDLLDVDLDNPFDVPSADDPNKIAKKNDANP